MCEFQARALKRKKLDLATEVKSFGFGKKGQIRKFLDRELRFLKSKSISQPREGWIRGIRKALSMSQSELGYRMQVNQRSVHALEKSELNGTIQIKSLVKAANAMDCELFYAFVPRTTLEEFYSSQALAQAIELEERIVNTMALENQEIKFSQEQVLVTARRLKLRDAVSWR